ncbi:MAG: phosphotransferase, partial [Pseudonocardiales bacterium]|nr:phosphotransferase [Pseudonocardiales bacterium]
MTHPTLAPEPDTDADATFRNWMRLNLAQAAEKFGMSVTGAPVFGWRLRSIGAVAHGPNGSYWLRVVSEQPQWATGEFWTGNQDASILTGLPKPVVLASTEWNETDWRSQRAELMTLLPGEPCSPSDVLRTEVELPDSWCSDLRRSLRYLNRVPTTRITVTQSRVTGLVRAAFGQHRNLQINHWETVHGDLHWSNLLLPQLGILDWEMWGKGPAGTDVATLYCYGLLNPDISHRIHSKFADILDSPDGVIAQLWVAARLLKRIRNSGDFPDLETPLLNH